MEFDAAVKNYILALAEKAQEESAIFPVDRNFLMPYLKEITALDISAFLHYNFEMVNDTYVNQLLACLPELWENTTIDDIIRIAKNFTNPHSFFTLIKFTHKIIEIDIIPMILNIARNINYDYFLQIEEYLKNQWNVLVKSESDLEDFTDGFIDVDINKWKYLKQKFLIDKRVKPAILSASDMKNYIDKLVK